MKVILANPRGFCAGVVRAVDIINVSLRKFPPPIYVRKEIVHNKIVVEDFRRRGVIFVDHLSEVPAGNVVIFSAHGVSPEVRRDAKIRGLKIIDATCPLVTKVHLEVHRFLREGYTLVLIGHGDHDEVEGTMGEAPGKITLVETVADVASLPFPDDERIMILTQTTLSLDETRGIVAAIKSRYANAKNPPKDDICYATQNRQDAVKFLLEKGIDVLLVVGSKNSSNSQRLVDVARQSGKAAYLIDEAREVDSRWLKEAAIVGVTAGASAPEHLVIDVLGYLQKTFNARVEEITVREENVEFSLPKELLAPAAGPVHG